MIVSIGIDIVEVERIERAIDRHGPRFKERLFTPAEIDYCEKRGARFILFAGRFVVKEAALKALGTGWGEGVAWREVEILPSGAGAPQLLLHGIALERFRALGATRAHVSISHTQAHAVAQVIFESEA